MFVQWMDFQGVMMAKLYDESGVCMLLAFLSWELIMKLDLLIEVHRCMVHSLVG